jgi:hypothetical protein
VLFAARYCVDSPVQPEYNPVTSDAAAAVFWYVAPVFFWIPAAGPNLLNTACPQPVVPKDNATNRKPILPRVFM